MLRMPEVEGARHKQMLRPGADRQRALFLTELGEMSCSHSWTASALEVSWQPTQASIMHLLNMPSEQQLTLAVRQIIEVGFPCKWAGASWHMNGSSIMHIHEISGTASGMQAYLADSC